MLKLSKNMQSYFILYMSVIINDPACNTDIADLTGFDDVALKYQ